MELVKNKSSGKYFIVLDDNIDAIDFLLITPNGKVIRLERRLFDDPDFVDPNKPPWRHRLTELQLEQYEEYFDQ